MAISSSEIKDSADRILRDPHFEIRLKKRNIMLEEVLYQLKYRTPEIRAMGNIKYKLSYTLENGKYLCLYVLKTTKGLKALTVFIEKR